MAEQALSKIEELLRKAAATKLRREAEQAAKPLKDFLDARGLYEKSGALDEMIEAALLASEDEFVKKEVRSFVEAVRMLSKSARTSGELTQKNAEQFARMLGVPLDDAPPGQEGPQS